MSGANMNLYHHRGAQWVAYLCLFGAMALLPLIIQDGFTLNLFARYLIYGLLAVSVSFIWGFAGVLSLGQGIAFGVGAYGMAMTMQLQVQDPVSNPVPGFMLSSGVAELPMLWRPFWDTGVGVALSLAAPTAFFALFGFMMFQARVTGVFVAIMTLAMLAAFYSIATGMQALTGGFNGISPPLPFQWGDAWVDPFSADAYWICLAALAAATLCLKAMLSSKFGLVIQAVRDDAERVRFLGYSVAAYQVIAFAVAGFVAALAGVLWVMLVQYVSPTALELRLSIAMVIWCAVGGRASLFGAVIGALLVNGMESYLGDELEQLWLLFIGGVFIAVVLLLPQGLAGLFETLVGRAAALFRGGVAAETPDELEREI